MKKIILVDNNQILDQVKSIYEGSLDIFVLKNKNDQKEILNRILKTKSDAGIYIDGNLKVDLIHKKLGGWASVGNHIIDLYMLEKLDLKPNSPSVLSNKIPFGKKSELVKFSNVGISFDSQISMEVLRDKIKLLEGNDFNLLIKLFNEKYGYFKYSTKRISKKKAVAFNSFKKNLKEQKVMPGLKKPGNINDENDSLNFTMGTTAIAIKEEQNTILIYALTNNKNRENAHYFHNGIINNLNNNICDLRTSRRKLKKAEILLSLIGLTVFIILTVFTFTKILNPDDVSKSLEIIFDPKTLKHPWIYLLWFNFFLSYFFSFIMMYIISYSVTGKKPNARNLWTYFVAAQLKATAKFITGEEILATILWGWYVVKRNNIRTSRLVGGVASLALIRAIFVAVFGVIFMGIGQSYMSDAISGASPLYDSEINIVLFYILSWGGMIWIVFDKLLRFGIVYSPPAHYLYNKIYTRIALVGKNSNIFDSMQKREMSLISLKGSTKGLFKDKEKMIRISLMIFIATLLEALELMYIFNIIESFNNSQVMHYNFLQLSGARFMITQTRHFPGINIMPGSGIGVIEHFMSHTYEIMYIYSHGAVESSMSNISLSEAESFANQTTFLTRFFNVYLMRILSTLISAYVILKAIIRRKI